MIHKKIRVPTYPALRKRLLPPLKKLTHYSQSFLDYFTALDEAEVPDDTPVYEEDILTLLKGVTMAFVELTVFFDYWFWRYSSTAQKPPALAEMAQAISSEPASLDQYRLITLEDAVLVKTPLLPRAWYREHSPAAYKERVLRHTKLRVLMDHMVPPVLNAPLCLYIFHCVPSDSYPYKIPDLDNYDTKDLIDQMTNYYYGDGFTALPTIIMETGSSEKGLVPGTYAVLKERNKFNDCHSFYTLILEHFSSFSLDSRDPMAEEEKPEFV